MSTRLACQLTGLPMDILGRLWPPWRLGLPQ